MSSNTAFQNNATTVTLPEALKPVGNYVGYVVSNNQVVISGQLPIENGKLAYIGKVGDNVTTEEAAQAARLCMLNILAQLNEACGGNLTSVKQTVKINVFVNSTPDFTDQPVVANGASDLLVEFLGERGKHARAAVGVATLPKGVAVEVDAVFELEG